MARQASYPAAQERQRFRAVLAQWPGKKKPRWEHRGRRARAL